MAAYAAVSPQRIVTAIDPSQLSQVSGNVPFAARGASDLGPAPADLALTEMSIRFNMTQAQENTLTQLLMDQQNVASGRYQQWLTPEQFAVQFGLAPADIQKVSSWLTSQGFTVTGVARGGTFISFTGTAAQVQNALHTQIHRVTSQGESHFTNLTEPQLPTAIAKVTNLITGLHDFRLKPRFHQTITPASTVDPKYTSAASGNHFLAPADFWTIYDENNLLTSGTNGTGVKVAVMGQTDINLSDIATFRSLGGLSATAPTVMLYGQDPGQNSGDLTEAELDVEWSGATGPGATIIFVNSTNVISGSLTQAIDNDLAPILSVSYGLCEAEVQASGFAAGQASLNYYNGLIQQASAQGQTVVASAGDSGATDCDRANSPTVSSASLGLAVDWPSVLPGVTSIGGTTFVEGTGTYWSATNNATNNSSVLSYIPETVWNESIADAELSAGGGGASAYFTKPYWQVGTGVPADSARDVPDVSMQATLGHDAVLICTPGFCTNGTYKDASGSHDIVGGTSVGAPSFAGLMSLVVQRVGHPVGNANPTIYALANSSFYSSVFHDVSTGSNAQPCTAGTVSCPAGGTIGYSAGVGYDLASGWGSVDVFNLVTDWNLVTPLTSPIGLTVSTTTLFGTPSAVIQGTTIAFTSITTPGATGTVQFLLDNVAQGSPVAINGSGVATFSLNTTNIPNGAHTVQAAYSGDAMYAGSKGSFSIVITSSGVPDFSITPATSTVTIAAGSSGSVALTVNGLNSFSGSVTLTASSVTNETSSFSVNPISLLNTKTAGVTTLSLFAFKSNAVGSTSASSRPPATLLTETGSGIALAGILMLVLPRRRRFVGALAAVLSIGIFAVSGCGGGGNVGGGGTTQNTNTAPGTYTITVTGSGTSGTTTATHTATVTLVVQ